MSKCGLRLATVLSVHGVLLATKSVEWDYYWKYTPPTHWPIPPSPCCRPWHYNSLSVSVNDSWHGARVRCKRCPVSHAFETDLETRADVKSSRRWVWSKSCGAVHVPAKRASQHWSPMVHCSQPDCELPKRWESVAMLLHVWEITIEVNPMASYSERRPYSWP